MSVLNTLTPLNIPYIVITDQYKVGEKGELDIEKAIKHFTYQSHEIYKCYIHTIRNIPFTEISIKGFREAKGLIKISV